jgi:carboxylesterase type B
VQAPEKPVGWNGTRNARKYAEPCIHYHIGPDDIEIVNGKEDCLYLNVHTPTVSRIAGVEIHSEQNDKV